MFKFDSTDLTDQAETFLKKKIVYLKKNLNAHYQLVGYTDCVVKLGYNEQLSQKRADAVMRYRVSQGVNRATLTIKGMGSNDPVADNATEKGRMKNRRVEIKVIHRRLH